MKIEIKHNTAGYWNLYVNDILVLENESHTVVSNIKSCIEAGAEGTTECQEVAESIIRPILPPQVSRAANDSISWQRLK